MIQKYKNFETQPSMLTSMTMAGFAGILTVNVIHPLDVIKTRLQISGNPN